MLYGPASEKGNDFGIFPSEILGHSIAVDYIQHSTTRTHFQLTIIPETVTKVDWVCGSRVKDTKTLKTFEISKVLKSLFECPNVFTSMAS